MSRRRGEFEHRTSIFEGAFRAWSHLGGLDPLDLENKAASELDPLTNHIDNDTRINKREQGAIVENPDGTKRRQYPYEPLPRSGLAHPYVQAILSPWLGPDADNEAIQLGLTTLRTWWQHRRKGESGSAIAALGTEKMKGVVEGYTRHFFTLAHCLVVNDKEQPPRSLHTKMKDLEKQRKKGIKKRTREDGSPMEMVGSLQNMRDGGMGMNMGGGGSGMDQGGSAAMRAEIDESNLSPLERLHAAQRRHVAENDIGFPSAVIDMKNKCIPGKIDLPGVVDAVQRHANHLVHQGGGPLQASMVNNNNNNNIINNNNHMANSNMMNNNNNNMANNHKPQSNNNVNIPREKGMTFEEHSQYGNPETTPIVYVSSAGDNQIAMKVDGITCAHCVKIVETVLKGANGNKSPIDGLVDASADKTMCSVIIKIDKAINAKRVSSEAARNLAMVGYTAKPKDMNIFIAVDGKRSQMNLNILAKAFEMIATKESDNNKKVFDWDINCTCPDNGVLQEDCKRHSQMKPELFDAFEARGQKVTDFMSKEGMQLNAELDTSQGSATHPQHAIGQTSMAPPQAMNNNNHMLMNGSQRQGMLHGPGQMETLYEQQYNGDMMNDYNFGMEPPAGVMRPRLSSIMRPGASLPSVVNISHSQMFNMPQNGMEGHAGGGGVGFNMGMARRRSTLRNPSIISYGNGIRSMSMTSEATFGRAMSGLSALSIDWENLEDFDLDVDHSAHINNNQIAGGGGGGGDRGGGGMPQMMRHPEGMAVGPRRSSLRRSFMNHQPGGGNNGDNDGGGGGGHVSFKVT